MIDRANALKTGLGASVWGQDLQRAERMARQMSAGSVCKLAMNVLDCCFPMPCTDEICPASMLLMCLLADARNLELEWRGTGAILQQPQLVDMDEDL